jgi:nitrite reductase/ring-hydroxylating ferredoxin subunit/uncharacterized membrane protein
VEGGSIVIGLRVVDALAQQRWLDRASQAVQKAVQSAFAAGGAAGRQLEDLLHGTGLAHPIHPALTDVPVGAWTVALVFDALEAVNDRADLAPGADAAVALGLAGAVAAASTGIADWQELDAKPLRVGLIHGALNISATALYAASLIMRRRGAREAGRNLGFAGYALALTAAYLGGDLVYRDQIGVSHANPVWTPLNFTPVLADGELAEGGLRRVDLGDRQIMLARYHGQVYALEEHCSHLGGPLSEGTLEDGCVQCPWHGSRFALEDGRPVAGPAAIPQPCFETRVRNGTIEVRAGQ